MAESYEEEVRQYSNNQIRTNFMKGKKNSLSCDKEQLYA